MLRIKDVCLNPKTGIAWYKKFIKEESSNWPIDKLLLWEPIPFLCQSLDYKVVNLPDNGFYHFLIEYLPRFLEIYEKNSSLVTVIGSESRYVLEVLDFLNITNYVSSFSPIKCRELLLSEKSMGGIFEKVISNYCRVYLLILNPLKRINLYSYRVEIRRKDI